MSSLHKAIGLVVGMMATIEVNQDNWKEEIRQAWEESKKLPRKKKKKVRKSLLIDWQVASWSIFEDF